jgi:hypothetical protein
VDVHVGGAGHDAGRSVELLRDLQPGSEGEDEEEGGREQRHVAYAGSGEGEAAGPREAQASRRDVTDGRPDGGHDDGSEEQPLHEPQERQREDVEGHVAAQYRVLRAERDRVPEEEPSLPL